VKRISTLEHGGWSWLKTADRSIMLELTMLTRARTSRRDLYSYRLGHVEDLDCNVFKKRISTLEYVGWSWLKTPGNFPVFG
jgi:hypothetical protein